MKGIWLDIWCSKNDTNYYIKFNINYIKFKSLYKIQNLIRSAKQNYYLLVFNRFNNKVWNHRYIGLTKTRNTKNSFNISINEFNNFFV